MIERQRLLLLLAASQILVPLKVWSQSTRESQRIGILLPGAPTQRFTEVDALLERLSALGWTQGKNLIIERRWVENSEQLRPRIVELLASDLAVLIVPGPQATLAALAATQSVPLVTIGFTDPVAVGVVANLARPGGNLTGVTVSDPQLFTGKRLEIIAEALPGLQRAAVLWDAGVEKGYPQMDIEASRLGLRLHHLVVSNVGELEHAFRNARTAGAGAMVVMETPLFTLNAPLVAQHGIKYQLPVMTLFSRMVEDGALISYGPNLMELFRRAALHVDKILRGNSPATIPMEQPDTFELVINLRTAKALNKAIPPRLLARVDRIVE